MNLIRSDIRTWFVMITLIITLPCHAQEYREGIFLHLDRSYYLAGESILYTIYCVEEETGKPSKASALAHVELLDREGGVIRQAKVRLSRGVGWGRLIIPGDCSSQEHIIRCYTSWMRNFGPESYHYSPVLLINPEKPYQPLTGSDSLEVEHAAPPPGATLNIRARGLQGTYGPRDSIVFTLETQAPAGFPPRSRLSLSITRSGAFNLQALSNSFVPGLPGSGRPGSPGQSSEKQYLPDLEGVQVTGSILHRGSRQVVAGDPVILSFIDTVTEIYLSRTDEEGRFRFDLNGLTGKKDMIIQSLGGNGDILITIDPDFSQEPVPKINWSSLDQEGMDEMFGEMLLSQQLSQVYGTDKTGDPGVSRVPAPRKQVLPFYGHHDHRIVMEKFIKLPVMEEVFRELGKRVFLVREKGEYRVAILDLKTNRIIGDQPFFFLDGVPFFDSRKLLELDPSQIKSISLKSTRYFMGDLVMDGIIDIRSRKGDASLIEFPRSAVRQYFQALASSGHLSTTLPGGGDPHIPLYRTTLLYHPPFETGPGEKSTIVLQAPDAAGSYDIILKGICDDGRRIEEHLTFSVVPQN